MVDAQKQCRIERTLSEGFEVGEENWDGPELRRLGVVVRRSKEVEMISAQRN